MTRFSKLVSIPTRLILLCIALVQSPGPALAQAPVSCGLAHPGECLKDVAKDQAGIWTSPLHIKRKDAIWLLPLASATALALHYDIQAQNTLGLSKTRVDVSTKIANFGSPYATAGGAAGLYLIGLGTHNEHLSEAGRLSAEAIIDASIVAGAIKLATNRQRLGSLDQGQFWPNGAHSFELNSSFPSGHAIASWAIARVVATEYPSKPVQIAAYAFATAISVCRVTGRAHFPTDVVIGSTFGYLIGGYVTRHHKNESVLQP